MPQYKLTYFDLKGLGEPIRYMLAYLGEDFQDDRFPRDKWPALKPKTPFGKVPILEVDGKQLTQSVAITRYLAKQANLIGKNDWESLQMDIVVDTFTDLRMAIAGFFFTDDKDETKATKKSTLFNETLPFYLSKFEEMVKKNGGYIATESLSWADIYLMAVSDTMSFMLGKPIYDKYPHLQGLKDKVEAIPKIKAWIAKRPKTDL